MTYLQTNKRPYQRARQTVTTIIVVIVIIIAAVEFFAPHIFPSLFMPIAKPFWRMEFAIESGSLKSPTQLLSENEELTRQLSDAQIRHDTIEAVEQENAELKALFSRGSDKPKNAPSTEDSLSEILRNPDGKILAAVLKRPPFVTYDELIIDIGSVHGISTSSLIYATGNVLIGRVVDVLSKTAKVKLFSSPGEKYEVLIGSGHSPAIALGRGGGQYEAQVARDTIVKEGDFVLSPSLSDKPFGIVSAVLQDPTLPFEIVLFAPPVNIYQLRWVLVKK